MKRYVAGFLFDETLQHVVLIRKNRPEWQAGKYNAVGGKCEKNEHPLNAMVREFEEEAGLFIAIWTPVCTLSSGTHLFDSRQNPTDDDWVVDFFASVPPRGTEQLVKTMTDEQVVIINLNHKREWKNMIPNLEWLIPMAKECLKSGGFYEVQEG